jgi:dTMP kinase
MRFDNLKSAGEKGVLIVFEGISGSGKSENIKKICSLLQSKDYRVAVVEWNSNKRIRRVVDFLKNRGKLTCVIYSIFQWISFLIDYYRRILPLLKKGYIVLADRYIYSGFTRDAINGTGNFFSKFIERIARKPDLLFFFNTSPAICYERIKLRGTPGRRRQGRARERRRRRPSSWSLS